MLFCYLTASDYISFILCNHLIMETFYVVWCYQFFDSGYIRALTNFNICLSYFNFGILACDFKITSYSPPLPTTSQYANTM
jgi:hypothetical protein